MFCPECGEKNEKNASFCENCGTKLNTQERKQGISVKEKWKNLSKQKKIGFLSVLCLLLFLGIFYTVGKNSAKPEKIAEKYFLALIESDTNTMYTLSSFEKNEFTTKEAFQKFIREDDTKFEVNNYHVEKAILSEDGLTASVKITFTLKGLDLVQNQTFTLTKSKEKKWLFFDEWKVPIKTTSNMQIRVMKDATLYLNDIEVDKKYLDLPTNNVDIYELPALFPTSYTAKVVYPFGEAEEKISVGSYSTSKVITKVNMNIETMDALKETVSSTLNVLYENALKEKSYEEVTAILLEKIDTQKMKSVYNKFAGIVKIYKTISDVQFSNPYSMEVSLTKDGEIYVKAAVSYKYKATIEEEVKEYNRNYTFHMIYVYENGNFKLTDIENINTYFYS